MNGPPQAPGPPQEWGVQGGEAPLGNTILLFGIKKKSSCCHYIHCLATKNKSKIKNLNKTS